MYIIVFVFSFMLCRIGEKKYKQGKSRQSLIYIIGAVMLVSILAGIRDCTIGTDIKTYGHWMFEGAKKTNSLLRYIKSNTNIEVGYSIFVFIIAKLFESEHWLYFFTGLFTYYFTMFGFAKFKKYISLSWTWCAYLFLLYGDTLNAMRQCMALAVVLWAFPFALDRKYKKYIIWTIFAGLFHNTAVLTFGIYFIYWILTKKNSVVTKAMIVLGTIGAILSYNQLLSIMMSVGILSSKYERYLTVTTAFSSLNPILVRIPFWIVIVFFSKTLKRRRECDPYCNRIINILGDFIILMSFIELFVAEMRVINVALYRLAFFFTVYRCVAIGRVVDILCLKNRITVKCVFLILFIGIWTYQNVIMGNNGIYPFSAELIGL